MSVQLKINVLSFLSIKDSVKLKRKVNKVEEILTFFYDLCFFNADQAENFQSWYIKTNMRNTELQCNK